MKVKLIASDLDGTLLTDEKEITPFTREVLEEAVRQGVCFVPATGRAFASVPEAVKSFPGVEYIITSNGAAIYSLSREKRIYERLLETEAAEAVWDLMYGGRTGSPSAPCPDAAAKLGRAGKAVALEVFVDGIPYAEEAYVAAPERYGSRGYGIQYVKSTRQPVADMSAFLRKNLSHLDSLSFVSGDPILRASIGQWLRDRAPRVYITSSVDHLVEVAHQDAGKGRTLCHLLDLLGISPDQAAAFGDADNDLEMLSSVKYGIAMANGTPACRGAAWAVTGTNQNDGVAQAIRGWLS